MNDGPPSSREEFEALIKELTALFGKLEDSLARERVSSNDLQNILYSTDVATIVLDTNLTIRIFTPAAQSLFRFVAADLGRPLEDLGALAADGTLLADARTVLQTAAPTGREIELQDGAWFVRRVHPYLTQDNAIEGVVVTYSDVTKQKRAAVELEEARQNAELANAAKSRFLAVASHDLRQPLQTLTLLQRRLAKRAKDAAMQKLVEQMADTLGVMSGMLNALLDGNQIEAGKNRAKSVDFPVDDLLARLKEEFAYHAEARGLDLRVVPCSLSITSDPRLLEQVIRNLLSNAIKYTRRGKVLIGCRRHPDLLSIEIWDTGIGISDRELPLIFEEDYRADRSGGAPGQGLGLSIVKRTATLLGHQLRVRSRPGKGSIFAIDVGLAPDETVPRYQRPGRRAHRTGGKTDTILIVGDDPEATTRLESLLKGNGHGCIIAPDAFAALELVARGTLLPDLALIDDNSPRGTAGQDLIAELRKMINRDIPAVILTGGVSADTLRTLEAQRAYHLSKPVQATELTQTVERILRQPLPTRVETVAPPAEIADVSGQPVVYIVDDDGGIREEFRRVLEESGRQVETYATSESFLEAYRPGKEACLLIDASLPGMSGVELLERLRQIDESNRLTAIMITGHGEVSTAVRAMKAGASDFIEKPVGQNALRASVERALERSRDAGMLRTWQEEATNRLADLTPRQRQILDLVLAGHPSKNIAADLGISRRTVENHRAAIMKKTGAKSIPALARLAIASAFNELTSEDDSRKDTLFSGSRSSR